ncbi:MAG: YkgJ family cysteine cluster protein [Alphaproteobacteria bacterium]|nr:YkgJ family cysteine cluster protein [Alphaproteobacteria bacterium]
MVKVSGPLKPGTKVSTTAPKPKRVSFESTLTDMRALAVATVAQARQNGTMTGARVVAAGIKEAYDGALAILEKEVPAGEPLACAAGCTHCCHLPVVTDAITVMAVADKVKSWPKAARKKLMDRLRERERKRGSMSETARRHHRAPCPMLVDGKCSVYEERPLICRSFNSFDAKRCERHFLGGGHPEGIDVYRIPYMVGEVFTEGATEGFEKAGLNPKDVSLDFAKALLIVLEAEDPAERFFDGEAMFEPARTTVKTEEIL